MRESGRTGQEDSLMKKSDDPFDPWVVAIMGLLKSNEDGVLICLYLKSSLIDTHQTDWVPTAKWENTSVILVGIQYLPTIFTFSLLPLVFPGFKKYSIQYSLLFK